MFRPAGHRTLYALAVAIDAAERLDPYPRLAQVMQRIAIQQAAMRMSFPLMAACQSQAQVMGR